MPGAWAVSSISRYGKDLDRGTDRPAAAVRYAYAEGREVPPAMVKGLLWKMKSGCSGCEGLVRRLLHGVPTFVFGMTNRNSDDTAVLVDDGLRFSAWDVAKVSAGSI